VKQSWWTECIDGDIRFEAGSKPVRSRAHLIEERMYFVVVAACPLLRVRVCAEWDLAESGARFRLAAQLRWPRPRNHGQA
jgi:hypothetical protein